MPPTAEPTPAHDERPHAVVTDDRPPSSTPTVVLGDLENLAEEALVACGVTGPAELAVTLVDVATITDLNIQHLGHEGPTDVLSFPMDTIDDDLDFGALAFDDAAEIDATRLLGDVVICPEIAARNAPDHAGTFQDELALLCVHGILHVLGWDHAEADEARAMRAEEARVLAIVHRPVNAGTEIPT